MKAPRRLLSRALIIYMFCAFSWWAIHLWKENDHVFRLEKELLAAKFSKGNQGLNVTQYELTDEYRQLEKVHHKRELMILGEGLFFSFCMFIGMFIVIRSANREASVARQRRNFMLSITHELKSPIASMRLILETFSKHELSRDQREKLAGDGIRDAARLQNLVESLLLAARLEDNWRPLLEPVDLKALVREITASLQVRFAKARFHIEIPADMPPVQADKTGLTSVIQNLLENAVKYSPESALVGFIAEKRPEGKIALRVTDEGQGIPETERKAVFEKFYRLGNADTPNTHGTGLGLYIVDQVVKAHGGTISIAHNKPAGTIFTIEF